MISFDEAVELIRSVARPVGTESVPLERAAWRVLAGPVVARIDSPRADVSAMDGYAARSEDVANAPVRLRVVGESFAGARWMGRVEASTCARIFTGAAMPNGADRVVIQENVRREGDLAIIDEPPGAEGHIRTRGSDFKAGDVLLSKGRLLDPRAVLAAAAADVATVRVHARPRVHILSTGDELAEPGSAAERADAIPDSVSLGVASLVEEWGGEYVGRARLRDDLSTMQSAAAAALDGADVVVVTGGASVGEKDFAKTMFEPFGLELVFATVSMKPGKPVWLGRAPGKLVIGLPGNPTSAMVTARLLLAPLLCGMTGRAADEALAWRNLPIASELRACGARETFHRARSFGGEAEILSFQDSSAQKALAEANLLVRQRANAPAIAAGAEVEVLDF